ncbi:MAG: DNA glycosylase AlkZ-like family protein, partial [Bacteroidota bacterium]
IDWEIYPAFLKVYGPDGDLDYEYENGRLNVVERDLCRVIQDYGPIDSRQLWARVKTIFAGKRSRFTAALERLQSRFFITVAGGSLEGWTLHTWDLVERQVPRRVLENLPTKEEARATILAQTIRNCVAVAGGKLRSILRWPAPDLNQCLEALKRKGDVSAVLVEGEKSPWLIHG